ncbi:MAG TPA: hypothetical protein VK157_12625 [Phycisphaerales bacterium]|nr:hypothetical protein [Phycisphaerales bacterium]
MKRDRGEQLMCLVLVYFKDTPRDAKLLGSLVRAIHPEVPKSMKYFFLDAGDGRDQEITASLPEVEAFHRKHLATADIYCYGVGRGLTWDIHVNRAESSIRPLPRPAYMRAICKIGKSTDPFLMTNRVFDAVDRDPAVLHGFAVIGTLDWLHYGRRFTEAVQPLSWQETVEAFAWRFTEPHWTTRLRDVQWGTYIGPSLACKIPDTLRSQGTELVRAERFDEDFIWNTHPSGGTSVFVSRDPLQTANVDLLMPDDYSTIKAGWLRAKLRECDLL